MKTNKIFKILVIVIISMQGSGLLNIINADSYMIAPINTHGTIISQAIDVLRNDGHTTLADLMDDHYFWLDEGSQDEDWDVFVGTSPDRHFHHPYSHVSIDGNDAAGTYANEALANAISKWNENDLDGDKDAFWWLGVALHLLADSTNPHHSNLVWGTDDLEDLHRDYEIYVSLHHSYITNVNYGGIYSIGTYSGHYNDDSAFGWVDYAAHRSYPYYSYVNQIGESGYSYAAQNTLPLAVKLSAGFMKFFYDQVEKEVNINLIGTYLKVDNDWKDYVLGINKDGSYGEFYVHAACKRHNGIWDYESSYGPTHGNGYYVVNAGTYYENTVEDSGSQKLKDVLKIKWDDRDCYTGNKIKVTLREYDGTNYETIIGWEEFNIPNAFGTTSTYTLDLGNNGNTFKFKLEIY